MKNGYLTDTHELIILENNHSLMMSYDYQQVAMDTIVEGGDSNATVIGLVVQELDENKDVIFQWRSWDHFKITDATDDIDLTNSIIDYVHGNAIEMDYDGNILISSRHMDEITKINRNTGQIIWRWGGEYCKNNEFTFVKDPIGFSHQHDIRRLPNGNLTLFDNGNLHDPMFSRAAEYQMDEVNKLVTLIWDFKDHPQVVAGFMGSVQRLDNHNTIIGWGPLTRPTISEIDPFNDVALSLSLPDTMMNYRAFKFEWQTNIFVADPDTLFFNDIALGDSLTMPLSIINKSNKEIEINNLYIRDSSFSVEAALPITILPLDSSTIQITYKPFAHRDCIDNLHIRWDSDNEGISQIVTLIGNVMTGVEDNNNVIVEYSLSQNFPNPFNPITKIRYTIPKTSFVTLKVYDVLGREAATVVNQENPAGNYEAKFNAAGLSSGIYFYKLQAGNYTEIKKMILIK
jgi:hypothetical protein